MTAAAPPSREDTDLDAVAVVGMSCRFPGAPDTAAYWANLRDGACSIVDFAGADLVADGVDDRELADPSYVRSWGHLADADRFEAELFGFTPTQAAVLDPQHRLLLEAAWGALEDGGYAPRRGASRTGVWFGGSTTDHQTAAASHAPFVAAVGGEQVRLLTDREFLAAWVSYRLDLTGPSMNVQTACSTSLTAVHLAVQSLLAGECDAALAGGVSVGSVHRHGYLWQRGGILAVDGRCRPFDARGGGTVPGHGVGVVLLRRLGDALADGDPVHAVIRGSAVTNDGAAKLGFTAPSADQQTATIAEAWAAADLDPATVGYVELHGTGTELGDRLELSAASAAFAGAPSCRIGSVKGNIGHLDAAAGIAALIKTVLMLEHRWLVPVAGVEQQLPELAAGTLPVSLVERAQPWEPRSDAPRRAGVSSLGIGGTNVHVVLEEFARPVAPRPSGVEIVRLSARTAPQLATAAERLASVLEGATAPGLDAVAHTLHTGRPAFPVRACVLAASSAGASAALAGLTPGAVVVAAEVVAPEDLVRRAQAWVDGDDVAWPEPADVPRVHLPSYPFAGVRYGALRPGGTDAPPPDRSTADQAARVEKVLVDALGVDAVGGLDVGYFASGGDSMTAIHLIGTLRDELDIDVPVTLFLEEITLRALVDRIVALPAADHRELDDLLAEFEDGR